MRMHHNLQFSNTVDIIIIETVMVSVGNVHSARNKSPTPAPSMTTSYIRCLGWSIRPTLGYMDKSAATLLPIIHMACGTRSYSRGLHILPIASIIYIDYISLILHLVTFQLMDLDSCVRVVHVVCVGMHSIYV